MLLSKLRIQNFQSHKETELDFCDGLNTIVGSSGSGKSAIIKALSWLVFNRPGGLRFRNNKSKGERVSVEIYDSNNSKVSRVKSDSENLYEIDDFKFAAISKGVPEEVDNRINLSAINFQYQLDQPYLMSLSAGEVAKKLNEIASLEKIDSSISHASRRVKLIQDEIKTKEKILEGIELDIDNLLWANDANKDFISIEKAGMSISIAKERIKRLKEILSAVDKTNALLSSYNAIIKSGVDTEKFDAKIANISRIKNDISVLKLRIEAIDEAELRIKKNTIPKWLSDNFDKLQSECDLVVAEKGKLSGLTGLIKNITKTESEVDLFDTEMIKCKEKYDSIMPNTCPLCGKT